VNKESNNVEKSLDTTENHTDNTTQKGIKEPIVSDESTEPTADSNKNFKCFYCDIFFSSDLERARHRSSEHPHVH
ncbi:MAG: hypothetical protein ACJ71J_17165, partial [Nitrososphaeraceae archaeon]